jgi:hypothetical protein
MSAPLSRLALCALLPALGWAACAGGPSFDGSAYRSDDLSFRVGPMPAGWRRIATDQALIAFRDDRKNATVAVGGRCGKDGDDVPLQALTHHLFLHFTDRQIQSQSLVPLDEREALRTELLAKLDGVAKHYTVYVLKKDGCVYDFMHIADTGAPAEARAEFDRFVRGFGTL